MVGDAGGGLGVAGGWFGNWGDWGDWSARQPDYFDGALFDFLRCVVFVRCGDAEHRHHGIADELLDRPAVRVDDRSVFQVPRVD